MKKIVIELLKSESCPKCKAVKELVMNAIKDMKNVEVKFLDPILDSKRIVELGITTAPIIVINGKIKFSGKIPSETELRNAIKEEICMK